MEEVYTKYFEIIEDHYGRFLNEQDPAQSVRTLLKKPLTSRILYQTSDTVVGEINSLFSNNTKKILKDISELEGLNCSFSGGVAPKDAERFLCKSGLYVDTTLIPDPLTFIQNTKKSISGKSEFSRWLFSQSFNMLKLKKALINDCEQPILRIIPQPIFIKSAKAETPEIEKETLAYFNQLFGEEIGSIEELNIFLSKLKSESQIQNKIKNRDLLIPGIKAAENIAEGIKWLKENAESSGFPLPPAKALQASVYGSMAGNLVHFNFAKNFNLLNSFESPNSWHYFQWMLKHESAKVNKEILTLNSITLNKVKWFGDLQMTQVVKARERSCLQDFREILSKELRHNDEDTSVDELSRQINYNLKNAFKKHEDQLKDIESEFNFSYTASSTGVVGGTISLLAGVVAGNSISSVGGGLALGGSLISWARAVKKYANTKERILSGPIGILFDAKDDDKNE